jgi:hypothetical protein
MTLTENSPAKRIGPGIRRKTMRQRRKRGHSTFSLLSAPGADFSKDEKVECPVRRERCRSSAGASPAWQLSLQPVAIGEAAEATKSSKPPMVRVTHGDPASVQAATRVNAEQASKILTREPTFGTEGRQPLRGVRRANPPRGPAGVVAAACTHTET